MGKHKANKKKQQKKLKHNVKKRVQKIKELTAQDLLLHPELLQSPQFKALPLEKQFQLTTQLKQLRMMMNKPMMGMGAVSSGNTDSLYSKYLDSNSRLQQAQNETQKLKQEIAENERQKNLEAKKQNELKEAQNRYNQNLKHKNKMKTFEREMDNINAQYNTDQIQELTEKAKEIRNTPEQRNAQNRLNEWQKQNEEFMKGLGKVSRIDYEKALELYELSQIEAQKKTNQTLAEFNKNQEELQKMKEAQRILQEAANKFTENGETMKANETEHEIANLSGSISLKQKSSISEKNDIDDDEIEEIEDQPTVKPPQTTITEEIIDESQQDFINQPLQNINLEEQNINMAAQKIILQDKINIAEEELKTNQQLQHAEEAAGMTQKRNEQLIKMREKQMRHQLLQRFDEKHNNNIDTIVSALNLQGSTKLQPYVADIQTQIRALKEQYAKAQTNDEKMKIGIEANKLNDEMISKLDDWTAFQETLTKQLEHMENLQIEHGIKPNQDYRTNLTHEVNNSSPTKLQAISSKVTYEQKQLEQGIKELEEIDKLRNSAYNLADQLQQNLIKHNAKNPESICNIWRQVINSAGDSKQKLEYIVSDLTEEAKKAETNIKITLFKANDYLNKLASFNEDKINVGLPNEPHLFEGDDSWINDIKPNDKFDFELKDIEVDRKATTGQVFESVIGRILKEGAKIAWNHKWSRYLIIGGGLALVVRFLPGETGNILGNIAGKLSVGLANILGKQFHQIPEFSNSYWQSIQPQFQNAHKAITPHIQQGLNFANQMLTDAYNSVASTEGGKTAINMLKNTKDIAINGLNVAATTLKATGNIANAAAPLVKKGLNAANTIVDVGSKVVEKGIDAVDFLVDKSGKVVSSTVDGIEKALSWTNIGSTNIGKTIYSAIFGSSKT